MNAPKTLEELKLGVAQALRSAEQAAREMVREARSIARQEPEFIATIKARSMIRAQMAKGRQMGFQRLRNEMADEVMQVRLELSHGQWRAITYFGALLVSHECFTECARRAKLLGFSPMVET